MDITEVSSSDLSIVFLGSTYHVTAIISDNWSTLLPAGYSFGPALHVFSFCWTEPDSPLVNCAHSPALPTVLDVVSDSLPTDQPTQPDGTTFTIVGGLVTPNGLSDLSLSFHDSGDPIPTPEPPIRSYMLLSGLVSVMAFRRKLRSLLRAAVRT
jgi:hypothetical protein